jgi:hypothetical protein
VSRYGPNPDGITIARLSGTATRHAREPGDRAAAIAELIEIATEKRPGQPPRLRTDLMTHAAGSMIGGYWHSALSYWSSPAAAELLIEAGADREQVKVLAAETLAYLRGSSGPGIGGR